MSEPLDSETLKELAAGYVLGDLSSEEAEQFHQLVKQVPALSIEVAALQAALHMMPYGLAEQWPNAELRSRTITAVQSAAIRATEEGAVPSGPIKPQIFRKQRWVLGGIAAGVLMVLGIGVLQQPVKYAQQPTETAQGEQVWAGVRQLLEDHHSAIDNPEGPADFMTWQPERVLTQLKDFQTTEAALPMLPESQAKLLGASDCQFGKTSGLRLSFQMKDHPDKAQIVSAYQLDLEGDQFPQFVSSTITLRQSDGTSIVLWREESYLYALVAELPSADLDRLAHSVGQI